MQSQQPYALLWDMDGVLVDSGEFHYRAWREILRAERDSDITYEEFRRTFGLRNAEMLADYLGFELPATEVDHLSNLKEARYRALVHQEGLALLPGVEEWLASARREGWLQAVASSAPRANVETVVDVVQIRDFFGALVSAEDVNHGKPSPEVYLAAAARLGVPPQQCIVIEDAPVGVLGAHSAGMRCIGVLTTHLELQADIVARRLNDLGFDAARKLRRSQ